MSKIKILLTPQSQAKPLPMTFRINIHNVFIYLYKSFKEEFEFSYKFGHVYRISCPVHGPLPCVL